MSGVGEVAQRHSGLCPLQNQSLPRRELRDECRRFVVIVRHALDREPHEVAVLPCGHYTTGKAPFKFVDGWILMRFLKKTLVRELEEPCILGGTKTTPTL